MVNVNIISETIESAQAVFSAKIRIHLENVKHTTAVYEWQDVANEVEHIGEEYATYFKALEALQDADVATRGAVAHFIDAFGVEIGDTTEAEDALNDYSSAFIGEISLREHAEEFAEMIKERYNMSDHDAMYIDVDSIANDLEKGGDVTENGPFLFNSNW